jgi:hypothetical protein
VLGGLQAALSQGHHKVQQVAFLAFHALAEFGNLLVPAAEADFLPDGVAQSLFHLVPADRNRRCNLVVNQACQGLGEFGLGARLRSHHVEIHLDLGFDFGQAPVDVAANFGEPPVDDGQHGVGIRQLVCGDRAEFGSRGSCGDKLRRVAREGDAHAERQAVAKGRGEGAPDGRIAAILHIT